jgi:hypothetical protein
VDCISSPDVGGDPGNLVDAHAPLDPAIDGLLFVEGKVVARLRPQQDHDLLEAAVVRVGPLDHSGRGEEGYVLEISHDLAGQCLHRGDHVRQPGVHGACGHAGELGRGRVLHEDHARLPLDGLEAQRAVAAHARKNDADTALLGVLGQGAKEEINRQVQPARHHRIEQVQDAA